MKNLLFELAIKHRSGLDYENSIVEIVTEKMMVDIDEMVKNNKKRNREFVFFRQVTMCMLWEYSNLSLERIGKKFGKDHATVIHSIKSIKNLQDTNPYYRGLIYQIKIQIEKKFNSLDKQHISFEAEVERLPQESGAICLHPCFYD